VLPSPADEQVNFAAFSPHQLTYVTVRALLRIRYASHLVRLGNLWLPGIPSVSQPASLWHADCGSRWSTGDRADNCAGIGGLRGLSV